MQQLVKSTLAGGYIEALDAHDHMSGAATLLKLVALQRTLLSCPKSLGV